MGNSVGFVYVFIKKWTYLHCLKWKPLTKATVPIGYYLQLFLLVWGFFTFGGVFFGWLGSHPSL